MDITGIYPPRLLAMANDLRYYGRMNDPVSSAYIKGPCGDEMEFYLIIEDSIIKEAMFYTEGCIATRLCGEAVSDLVKGKDIEEALNISPKGIMDRLDGLPYDHRHCAILAASTFYKAVAEYFLKP